MNKTQWSVLSVVFSLVATPAIAQSTGSIVGQVTDRSGAVVAGVKVVVKSVETGLERPTTTTSEGYYSDKQFCFFTLEYFNG